MATGTDEPMDDEHRKILKRCKGTLVKDMEPRQVLLQMEDPLLFTTEEENQIMSRVTRQLQCDALLDMLPRKGAKAYDIFKKTIAIVQPHLTRTIIEAENTILRSELRIERAKSADLRRRLIHRTVKDGNPTDDELEKLGSDIKEIWLKLGRRLGVSDAKLAQIDRAYVLPCEKGYHVLKHWKDNEDAADATYQALCFALQHCYVQRQDLAEKFCCIRELKTAEAKGKDVENRLERKMEELKDVEGKYEDVENRLKVKQEELKTAEAKGKDVENRLERKQEELKDVEGKYEDVENRLKVKQEELKAVEAQCEEVENRLKTKREGASKTADKMETGLQSAATPYDKRMDDQHRKILKESRQALVEDMEPEMVLRQMIDPHLITDDEKDRIMKKDLTRQQQNEILLDILPRKGAGAYEVFKKTIEKAHRPLFTILVEAELKTVEAKGKDVENRLERKKEELKTVEAKGKDVENRLERKQEELKDVEGKWRDVESRLKEKQEELKTVEAKGKDVENRLERKQEVDERVVRNETRKFEAEHEECVRVLPYQLENGDIEIHLYVYGDKSGIPTKLEKAAQTFFGQYGWKLQWKDLYNDAFNVLQVTSIECSSGQPKRLEAYQVDEIEDTISKHLHIFSNHRNVTAVQPFFKVTKSIQTEEACIMVYVLGKGQIPMGEEAIPPAIGPYRVDIVNGFCVRTKDPYMPIEAHKQTDFLRLGASIGVYGKQSSGTLGAIVEDEKSGTLYALSCDHVMHDADESKIIHPGFDVYLNYLRFNLNGYKDWISRITGLDLQLPAISDDSTDEAELQNIFEKLRQMHVDLEGCSNSVREQITLFERNLEEAFGRRPRVIASYSAGVRRNVCSGMSDREHFIDAAISELDEKEVKNVKAEKFLQICDTTHYPSGNCIVATTQETMNVEEVFKSGSATGFTESRLILGSSQRLPTFIQDFRRNGECAWIDVDCIVCKKRRTTQTQVQEWTDPCEQCQEHSGWLKSCLCIQQHGSKPFSDKGDSGAVIFEKRRKENRNEYQLSSDGFGIIFAELPTQIGIFAIASPLETALKALSQKVSESRPDSDPCKLRLASSFT